MPPARDIDESIRMHLVVLAYNVENANQRNLQDINIYAEGVACGLLNILWGTNLLEINRVLENNYPAIDLLDDGNQLYIQVTSDDSLKKIRDTVSKSKSLGRERNTTIAPKILLLRFGKPQRNSTFDLNDESKGTFNNKDVICLNDLAHELQNQEIDKKRETLEFLRQNLPIPSETRQYSLEVYLLRKLFESLSTIDADQGSMVAIPESELDKKRVIYEEFWSQIQRQYQIVLSEQREKSFKAAFDRVGQADRERLTQYLGLESTKILDEITVKNPTLVIDRLKEKIMGEVNLPLISETDIVHFLYYEFRNCNVLPILDEAVV